MCAKILSTLDPDSATNTRFARLVYRLRLSSPHASKAICLLTVLVAKLTVGGGGLAYK